jgi:capsular polysaccharide biosynthesis protein
MELRHYWKIFKRRWLIALIPAVIVLIVGLVTYRPPPPAYNVGMRFIVGQAPAPGSNTDEQRYYNWAASEYIVNGLADWVRGTEFATAVAAELASQGIDVPAGAIQGGLVPDNTRSMLTLSLTYGDPELLASMMTAVAKVLTEQNALPQLGGERADLIQLDQPIVNKISPGLRRQLDLPLRIILALAAGLGLALLAEYLDPTMRERDEVVSLGLEILGEIPKR